MKSKDYYYFWMTKKTHKRHRSKIMDKDTAEEHFTKYTDAGYAMKLMQVELEKIKDSSGKVHWTHRTIKVNDRWAVIEKIEKKKALKKEEAKLLDRLAEVQRQIKELI